MPVLRSGPARVVVIGSRRAASSTAIPARDVFGEEAHVCYVSARWWWLRLASVRRRAAQAVTQDAFELIHLLDARLAHLGRDLRRGLGVPVTASVTQDDFAARGVMHRSALRSLEHLDSVFVDDPQTEDMLLDAAPGAGLTVLPLAAAPLPVPTPRAERAVRRALSGVEADRFVVAMPATDEPHAISRFLSEVMMGLDFPPLCVVFGVPAGAASRDVARQLSRKHAVRVVRGNVDAHMVAALAPYADAFLAVSPTSAGHGLDAKRCLLLASSGVPVIASAASACARAINHEANGFLVSGPPENWAAVLNELFALPPVQRQYLGEDFARRSFELAPVAALRAAYEERFAALAGRPHIPLELRAA